MTDTTPLKTIHLRLLHQDSPDENQAATELITALRESGESVSQRMRFNDSVDVKPVLDALLWVVQHPSTVEFGKDVLSGGVLILLDRWFAGRPRSLEVEFEGQKIVANSVDEVKEILASLPPPQPTQILQDGETMKIGGIIMPKEP